MNWHLTDRYVADIDLAENQSTDEAPKAQLELGVNFVTILAVCKNSRIDVHQIAINDVGKCHVKSSLPSFSESSTKNFSQVTWSYDPPHSKKRWFLAAFSHIASYHVKKQYIALYSY